ncbi:MAG TPA: hypothetical protein VF944_05770, partial [Candidatus Bathyarchaeia archaeon]
DVPGEIEQVSADGAYEGAAMLRRAGVAIGRGQPPCPAKGPGFGATPTARRGAASAARTCGGSEESGANSGSGRATIIAGAWRRHRSSASRRSSATGCKRSRLIINSKN